MFENTPEDYEAIGEGGERTLNALKTIVHNAQNSTEIQPDNTLIIEPNSDEWIEDENDDRYVSKSYSIKSVTNHLDYEVLIEGNLPDGTRIAKLDGTDETRFSQDENFKIMLLKENLNENGLFKINIKTEMKLKPVIYGGAPDASWQNYALTAYMYVDSIGTYEDTYEKIEKPEKPEKKEQPAKEQPKPIEEYKQEIRILPVTGM